MIHPEPKLFHHRFKGPVYDYLQRLNLKPEHQEAHSLFIQAKGREGELYELRFANADLLPFFEAYEESLISIKQKIGAEFTAIKEEIEDWLRGKYLINPKPSGFVEWFLQTKLGEAFRLFYDEQAEEMTLEAVFPQWTSEVLEQHLVEYCHYRAERLETHSQTIQETTLQNDESSDSSPEQKNTFNEMPIEEVKRFFMQLATSKTRKGESYLSPEDVEKFVHRAFTGNHSIPQLTLNNPANRHKGRIIGLFHTYYSACNTHHPKTGRIDKNADPDRYIRLLTDNFDNWTFEQVKGNFRSGGNWKNPA